MTSTEDGRPSLVVGRLFRADQLYGYLAVDKQGVRWWQGRWPRRRTWRTVETRWRVEADAWGQGFLTEEEIDQLAHNVFRYYGEDPQFRGAVGQDRLDIVRDYFAKWT